MLDVRVRFFDIKKAGIYSWGGSEPAFSNISDMLVKAYKWAKDGRDFSATTTYEPEPDKDILRTFFCDWARDNTEKDSVLILWNEIPNDNGVIYGMSPSKKPGEKSMMTTGFGKIPAIPGFPSYFWFIPERNIFASIVFEHSIQGKGNLDRFLKGYLENRSPYRVKNEKGKVIGYSKDGKESENHEELYAWFKSVTASREGIEKELEANIGRIRRMIKRETLYYQVEDQRKTIERFFSGLTKETPIFNDGRNVNHEIAFKPNINQLREIINNFSESTKTSGSIKNVGFIFNDNTRIMLNGSSASLRYELDLLHNENQILDPKKVLKQLMQNKHSLLKILDDPQIYDDEDEWDD